jgi:hypothetical protein
MTLEPLYTRRYWYCSRCKREGFILQHRDESAEKALWRRLQAHNAVHWRQRRACLDQRDMLHWKRTPLETER